MSEIKIAIENCNNISKGVISLEEEKLNIRYGMNGTGKSTLSTAISLFSQGKPMDDLKPFGSAYVDKIRVQLTKNQPQKQVQ